MTPHSKTEGKKEYTVIYRIGVKGDCAWYRSGAGESVTREEAISIKQEFEKRGIKALYGRTADWDRNGLPEGWDADDVPGITEPKKRYLVNVLTGQRVCEIAPGSDGTNEFEEMFS